MGLLSGKKWGGVEKENFTGPPCMKGHPGQQYVIWEQLKTKPLQIVVSKSANRSAQSHEDKIISTSGNMVAVSQMKNLCQLTCFLFSYLGKFQRIWA